MRDGYGTGDTSQIQFKVRINEAPIFNSLSISSGIEQIVEQTNIRVTASADDLELTNGIVACRDLNPSIYNDDDGIAENDCEEDVNSEIKYYWDLDSRYEETGISTAGFPAGSIAV